MKTFYDYKDELVSDFRYLSFTRKIIFLLFVLFFLAPIILAFIVVIFSGMIVNIVMVVLQGVMGILKS